MHILTISEVYPSKNSPQYGIFIKQQMDELKGFGHKIDVLMPTRGNSNTAVVETAFDGIRVFSVGYRVNRYELFLKQIAHSVYQQLKSLIVQNKYELLAVHITGDAILKIIVDIGNELGIAVVAHYHGLNVWKEYVSSHRIREAFYAKRRTIMLKKTQAIIGVSNKVSNIVQKRIKDVPVYTVYNGVETQLFYSQVKKENYFTIVGVGNLIPIKGFSFLIEAFAKIYEKNKNSRLKIIGDGVERALLEDQVNNKKLSDVVTFFGKIPYEEVANEMRNSQLFILPSYYEAIGCVYLEAMACGIPTIGVKGMGVDEIIIDGENGLLVEQKNVDSIVKQIERVINDKELAEKLSKNGRETALKYTWKNSAKELDKVYEQVVNTGR